VPSFKPLLLIPLIVGGLLDVLPRAGAAPAPQQGQPPCEVMALALRKAAREEARAQFWRDIALCVNDPASNLATGLQEAWSTRQAAYQLAQIQFQARLQACSELGHGTYDPQIAPNEFSPVINNPWFPHEPGQTRIYEMKSGDFLERVESTTLEETVQIGGFTCRQVHVVHTRNGVLIEDTLDWFGQRNDGAVWYFGELSQSYEGGFLDSLDGTWRTGKDGAKPGIMMLGTPTVGAIYRQEFQQEDAEDIAKVLSTNETVTTAYGTWHNCLKIEEWSPLENEREIKYYAPGVGFVLEINPATGERLELLDVLNG